MAFDAGRLSTNEKAIAGLGLAVLVSSFLPWYGVSALGLSMTADGWDLGASAKLGVILAVLAAVAATLRASEVRPNVGQVPGGMAGVTLAVAGLGSLLLLYRIVDLDSGSLETGLLGGVEAGRKVGIFLAVLASLAQTGFAFVHFRESGGTAGLRTTGPGADVPPVPGGYPPPPPPPPPPPD